MNKTLLRVVLLAVFATSLLWLIIWAAYTFILQPSINFASDSSVKVSVTNARTGNVVFSGDTASQTFRVDPGTYIVQAVGEQASTLTTVELGLLNHKTVTTSPSQQQQFNVIGTQSVLGLYPAQTTSASVDPIGFSTNHQSFRHISGLNSQQSKRAETNATFVPATSSDGKSFEVQENTATVYNLLTTELQTYKLPKHTQIPDQLLTDDFVYANGKTITARTPDGRDSEVLTTPKLFTDFSAGKKVIALYNATVPVDSPSVIDAFNTDSYAKVSVYIRDTKQYIELPFAASKVWLSPNEQYVVAQRLEGRSVVVYDIAKRSVVGEFGAPTLGVVWFTGDNTLLFERNGSVWSYAIDSNSSKLVTVLSKIADSISTIGDITYITTHDSTGAVVYSNKAQAPAQQSLNEKLRTILPYESDEFFISLSGTSGNKPAITIETMAGLTNPSMQSAYENLTKMQRRAALDYLRSQDINPAQLVITYTPKDPL